MHCVLHSPRSSFSVHRIISESCRCLGANASSSELRALDQIQRLDVGAPTNMTQRRSVSALQPPDPCQPMPASRAGTRIERSYYHRIAEACTASGNSSYTFQELRWTDTSAALTVLHEYSHVLWTTAMLSPGCSHFRFLPRYRSRNVSSTNSTFVPLPSATVL